MKTIETWHEIVQEMNPGRLDEIIAEDCVFHSPIIHSPQEGRELTKFYLGGVMTVFNDSFHYVKEVVNDDYAVLEFVCEIDGIIINGVDIMSFDDDGKIIEFKVMIRPLKAISLLHEKMREALAAIKM